MSKNTVLILSILALSACKATTPEPYKKDHKPEQRHEYNGLKGWVQSERDRVHLINNELKNKCDSAKISLAIAQNDNQTEGIEEFASKIKRVCK